jgi:shikimate dehydrogenase
MTKRAVALIGDPVSHSVSPAMHAAVFRHAGLDLGYEALTVRRDQLADAFPQLRERFVGLNVTRPLKEAVIPMLDRISPEAERAGSVNTVVFGANAVGHSTDGAGFMAALRRAGVSSVARAVVLGTGGAARAVAASLIDDGSRVTVWGRNRKTGERLAADLRVEFFPADDYAALAAALDGADLLVNATPVGTRAGDSPVPSELVPSRIAVFDLLYRPRWTTLLLQADAAGSLPIHGIDMLIEQGARSFELWTGIDAPVDVMRHAAYAALEDVPAPAGAREAG